MTLAYWYLFPVAMAISTIAMASGIGGATFFSPFFMLVLGLQPEVAIGTGLITEVFGFASGVSAYIRKRLIDYNLGLALLVVTIPTAIIGTLIAGFMAPDFLKTILGMGLIIVALSFFRMPDSHDVLNMDTAINRDYGGSKAKRVIITLDKEEIRYTVCNKTEGRFIAGIGGLFVGLISTGLGELNGYFLMQRCRVPSKVSVATSVFIVAITVLAASIGHFIRFVQIGGDTLNTVLSMLIFTVPGVVIGGQVGAAIAQKIPQKALERGLGILFIVVAVMTLGEVWL